MNEKETTRVKQVLEYLHRDKHTIYKLARFAQVPSLKITDH